MYQYPNVDALYPKTDEEILDYFRRGRKGRVSENEYECLFLHTLGLDDVEISQRLDLSVKTVPSYRRDARFKLELESIPENPRRVIMDRRIHYVMRYIAEHRGEFYPYVAGKDVQFTIIDPHDGTEVRLWKPATPDEIHNEEQEASPIPTLILVGIVVAILTVIFVAILISSLKSMYGLP